jgi:hypothetical protein
VKHFITHVKGKQQQPTLGSALCPFPEIPKGRSQFTSALKHRPPEEKDFSRSLLGSSFPLVDIHVKNGVPVTNRHVISVIEHDAEHIVLNVPILSVLAHLGWNLISDKTNCYLHGIVLSILATDTAIALPNLRQLEAWISSAAATRSHRSISSSFHTSDVRAKG